MVMILAKIYKLECINHVAKRVGARLRNHVEKLKKSKQKLSDGKSIGGRGRLTGDRINRLQSLYRLAIVQNLGDLAEMKKAIIAIVYHSISTDEKPQHSYCPDGSNSWCKYNKLSKLERKSFKHKNPIPKAVGTEILLIFEELSKDELLKKCLHGKTQNLNESFNHLVWERAPKTLYSRLINFKICAYDAVLCWNDGVHSRIHVLMKLGMPISEYSYQILVKCNERRESQKIKLKSVKKSSSRCKKDYNSGNF